MKRLAVFCAILCVLGGCSQVQLASHMVKQINPPPKSAGTFKVGTPYKIKGRYYYPKEEYDRVETGVASWYGPNFHGKQTANGEIFDMNELTAAHRTLQMPSLVRVTNLENGRSLIVRINDRGPYKRGRVIDLSKRSAELLGFKGQGTAKVRLEVLKQESLKIAEIAKRGEDTSGIEVALNRGQTLPTTATPATVQPAGGQAQRRAQPARSHLSATNAAPVSVASVQAEPLQPGDRTARQPVRSIVPGHMKNGNFYPDEFVSEQPVKDTSLYVQAGSFSVIENARRMRESLTSVARTHIYPADVEGKTYYRVRLGPIESVDKADRILTRLADAGNSNAIIIVD